MTMVEIRFYVETTDILSDNIIDRRKYSTVHYARNVYVNSFRKIITAYHAAYE